MRDSKIRMGAPGEFFADKALDTLCTVPCRYEITLGLTLDLLKDLEKDKLDSIIATRRYDEVPGIHYEMLEEEELYLVAPQGMEVPVAEEQAQTWLEQQRWISYGADMPIIRRVWKQHFHTQAKIEPYHIIPDLRAIKKSVESGMGLSVLPLYLIRDALQLGNLQIIFPQLAVKNQLYIAFKMDSEKAELIRKVTRELIWQSKPDDMLDI